MRVVVASGHMTDGADRSSPRFPEASVDRVHKEVGRQFVRWGVGAGDLVHLRRRAWRRPDRRRRRPGLRCHDPTLPRAAARRVHLAIGRARGTDWHNGSSRSNHEATCVNSTRIRQQRCVRRSQRVDDRSGTRARGDGWPPRVDRVGRRRSRTASGGAAHMASLAAKQRLSMYTIDPTPRSSADRQWAPGPKKLLALDGGGIRGILTLGILVGDRVAAP